MLFLNGDDSAQGTEEFRTLRSRLYHLREKMPLKNLLVTSALPKEGKSFTAANLAQVMVRQHGRRALLIDADLRAPRLHPMLGTTSESGALGLPAGKERRVFHHAAGTDGKFVFHSRAARARRSGGTGGQRPAESCCCSGSSRCLTGSLSIRRRRFRSRMRACWPRRATEC